MANFAVPGTWTFNGTANNSQQSVYKVTGHTTAENYLVIFDRKVPSLVNGALTKPSVRIRIIRSFVNGSGVPLSSKAVTDLQQSWPVEADATKVKAMLTLMATTLSDVNIAVDLVDLQRIPLA